MAYPSHHLETGSGKSVVFLLLRQRMVFIDEPANDFLRSRMMKVAQTVKSGVLTNPGIDHKHIRECSEKYVLQFQILATVVSISISTMPVVAQ